MAQTISLSNSVWMPLIGCGTYKIKGQENIFSVVQTALETGYRLFDTASVYRNESDLGEAFKKFLPDYGLKREDIFITSKLGPLDHGKEACLQAYESSLKNLQLDYLDLYLIHWPGVQKLRPDDPENRVKRQQSWAALETLYKSGRVRSIGVSNYSVKHLEDLLQHSTVVPHVNQVEFHPHYQQVDLKRFCDGHGIKLQAYSSLGTTVSHSPLLEDPIIIDIATRLQRTPAQVLLRWATQQGVGVIPKSIHKNHIFENMDLNFIICEDDYNLINSSNKKKKYAWDPSVVF